MNQLQQLTMESIISCTMSLVDQQRCKAALTYARTIDAEVEAKGMILQARKRWLNWHTVSQRQWQRETRNPNKARHHDSIELRERYVRC